MKRRLLISLSLVAGAVILSCGGAVVLGRALRDNDVGGCWTGMAVFMCGAALFGYSWYYAGKA